MKDLYYTDFSGLAPWTSVDGYALCSSFSTQASQLLIPSRDEAWEKPTGPGHTMGTSPKKSCMIEETCGEIDKFVVGQQSCSHNIEVYM